MFEHVDGVNRNYIHGPEAKPKVRSEKRETSDMMSFMMAVEKLDVR